MKTYVYGLCEGRHPAPVKEGIFPTWVGTGSMRYPEVLRGFADKRIPKDCERLAVYVTGLTVAMMAVVSVCMSRGIHLTCYHKNKDTGVYDRQEVF